MKSRFSRFVLVSTLIHLLLLMLFSFQKVERVPIKSIAVDISLSSPRSSVSASSSSGNSSRNRDNQSSRSLKKAPNNSPNSTSASVKKVNPSSRKTVSSKANEGTTLFRNTTPVNRSSRDLSQDSTEIQSFNRQITLDKSKELIRSTSSSAQSPDQGDGQVGNRSKDSGFDADSVFEKSSSVSGEGVKGFDLETDKGSSGGGSAGGGKSSSSARGSQGESGPHGGFDWKDSEARLLVSRSELVFPKKLEGKGIDEEVRVGFNVAPDGKVYEIELIKSSGYAELDNAVKDQVRSFRFNAVSTKKVNKAEYSYLFTLKKK